jgi:hypothetical protein
MINYSKKTPFTIYFISNSGNSYLSEYIDTDIYYESYDISFANFDIKKLRVKKPAAIVVDLYFTESSWKELIESLITNFKDEQIYFLSPEFSEHNLHFLKDKQANHYFSSFSLDIIKHINNLIEGIENNNDLSDVG